MNFFYKAPLVLLTLVVGLLTAWSAGQTSVAWAAEVVTPTPVPKVYLPSILHTGKETVTPTSTATATPVPPAAPKALFAETQWKTSSVDIASDAQNGTHLVYAYYEAANMNAPTTGVYLYCASDCEQDANWHGVAMGAQVKEIQIDLTPQGQPRILYRSVGANNGNDFFYAACDQACTEPTQWTVTQVASNRGMAAVEFNEDSLPQRYFALDPQGRPRFVYSDRNTWVTPSHVGTFYAFCDQNCSTAANWAEVRINQDNGNHSRFEKFLYPALTFSPAGQPRVVADGTTMQDEFFLTLLSCDGNCDRFESWQRLPLFERGSEPNVSYDVAITSQGQPRIAFYQGALMGGQGNRLSYAWCNSGCQEIKNWQRTEIGLPQFDGQDPDLALDAAGRPFIAYALYNGGGLGYSHCTAECESSSATWQHTVVETRTHLQAAWPVAHPPHCDGGLWDGLTPVLVLGSEGPLRMAYDATYQARCWYETETNQWKPWHDFSLVKRAARLVLFPGKAMPTPTATPTSSATATTTTTATATVTATPTPPPAARLGTGIFMDTQWRTSSSSLAVDAQGGKHLAYVYFEPVHTADPHGGANPTTAVYRFCAAQCEQVENWSTVRLGEHVSEVQIELTPAGQPRLLLLVRAEAAWGRADRYVYAECDAQCSQPAQWKLGEVITLPNDLSLRFAEEREYQVRHSFALDPSGRPRFVHYHYNAEVDATGIGAYYASCEQTCAVAANWTHTRITQVQDWSGSLEWEVLEKPALTFTPDGQPRLAAQLTPLGVLRFPGLYYFACMESCTETANWQSVLIGQNGDHNGNWDIEVDSAGRPRVLLGRLYDNVLRYFWCDAHCNDSSLWRRQAINLNTRWPNYPDLELNAQDQPRIVYKAADDDENGADGLHYLWCNVDCESAETVWEQARIEHISNRQAEWKGSWPAACAGGEWIGTIPTLALDSAGHPHVAADALYVAECEYDAGSDSWKAGKYSAVWRAVRTMHFAQP